MANKRIKKKHHNKYRRLLLMLQPKLAKIKEEYPNAYPLTSYKWNDYARSKLMNIHIRCLARTLNMHVKYKTDPVSRSEQIRYVRSLRRETKYWWRWMNKRQARKFIYVDDRNKKFLRFARNLIRSDTNETV
jgi:predicted nucleotidyltransferase component of viral defense system